MKILFAENERLVRRRGIEDLMHQTQSQQPLSMLQGEITHENAEARPWSASATVAFSTTTLSIPQSQPATSLPVGFSEVYRGRSWYDQDGGGHEI